MLQAQFSTLKRLVKEAGHAETQTPVLPLIVAHGALWHPCSHLRVTFSFLHSRALTAVSYEKKKVPKNILNIPQGI